MVRFSIECGVKVTGLGDRLILRLKKGGIKKKKERKEESRPSLRFGAWIDNSRIIREESGAGRIKSSIWTMKLEEP